jgi:hypothetical protein
MPSRSVGTGSPADTESSGAGLGSPTEGIEARRPVPGSLAVQRSVHDLASLQYQRMSAQAWPPSGTSRPVGSPIPHNEHWADGKERLRSSRCVAIDESPHANGLLIGLPPALRTPSTGAPAVLVRRMRPLFLPRGTNHSDLRHPGTRADVAVGAPYQNLATLARTTQGKPQSSPLLHRKLRNTPGG